MSRLTSDTALVVILAVISIVMIFNAIIGGQAISNISYNKSSIEQICDAVDIQNDLLTQKFRESNKILEKRNLPGDIRLQTLNEVALNDLQDSADILKGICQ